MFFHKTNLEKMESPKISLDAFDWKFWYIYVSSHQKLMFSVKKMHILKCEI